jgi:hypothetical protein
MPDKEHHLISVKKINQYSAIIWGVLIVIDLISLSIRGIYHFPDGTIRMMLAFTAYVCATLISIPKYHWISSNLSIFITFLAIMVYPLLPFVTAKPPEDIFLLLFVYLVLSVLVHVVFSIITKWRMVIVWQSVLLLTFLISFFHSVHQLNELKYASFKSTFTDYPMIVLVYLGTLAFAQLLFIRFKKDNFQASKQLLEQHEELATLHAQREEQVKSLELQQEELYRTREELHHSHERLNQKIKSRSEKLSFLNNILERFGFINTQLIIHPVSQLQRFIQDEDINSHMQDLEHTVSDMDKLTSLISEFLNETDPHKLMMLENRLRDDYGITT